MQPLVNEVFALRDGERLTAQTEEPTDGLWLAVMLRSVEMPAGYRQTVRTTDGAPVEQCAVLACHRINDEWQWLQLSAVSKEIIGDLFFDGGYPKDQWLYLSITGR